MPSVDWDAELSDYYDKNKRKSGVEKVLVLDGQQRLQTLFAIFNGSMRGPGKTELEAYIDIRVLVVPDVCGGRYGA